MFLKILFHVEIKQTKFSNVVSKHKKNLRKVNNVDQIQAYIMKPAFQWLFYHFYRANLSPLASPRNTKPDSSPERSPVQKTPETVTPRVKSLTADGSPATGNQTWGPPRTVELEREQGKSLGISIVGQCLLFCISSIFCGC